MKTTRVLRVISLWLIIGIGCDEARGPTYQLLDDPAARLDADRDLRRRRMDITTTETVKSTPPITAQVERTARSVARQLLLSDCLQLLKAQPGGGAFAICDLTNMVPSEDGDPALSPIFSPLLVPGTPGSTTSQDACDQALCRMHVALCVSTRLLELSASTAATTIAITRGTNKSTSPAKFFIPIDVTIPPQDEESALALTEEAFHWGAWTGAVAGEGLRFAAKGSVVEPGFHSCTGTELSSRRIGTMTYGESLAASLVEATGLVDEASRAAVQHHVAIADAEYSRTADLGNASKLAWIDANMSRARAAHLLVGGGLDTGLADFTGGMCPVSEPSDRAKEALDILRLAAPNPRILNAQISFETLFQNGWSGDTSLRARLGERLGDSNKEDPQSLVNMSSEAFLASRGLREADFAEAKNYLKHEFKAFARDSSAQLPPIPVSRARGTSGVLAYPLTSQPIYAALATKPAAPPSMHLRTMTRFAKPSVSPSGKVNLDDGVPESDTAPVLPAPKYARRGLAQFLDYTASLAVDLIPTSASATTITSPVLDTLATLVTGTGQQTEARLESCYRYYSDDGTTTLARDEVRVRVYGYDTKPEELLIVAGPSGLRCAVEGKIDGAPCNLEDHKVSKLGVLTLSKTSSANTVAGLKKFAELRLTNIPASWRSSISPTWFYVVRRGAGVPETPGRFSTVGGFRLVLERTFSSSYRYCSLSPVNRDVEKLLAETLTPSTAYCGQAEKSCAGPSQLDRLPLEGELSQDGDPYESSWRTFLVRAKDAADRTDMLGEDLVRQGLELDTRIEAAKENLGNLCGGAINVFDFFPPSGGMRYGTCSDTSPCSALNTECKNGVCVLEPMKVLKTKATQGDADAQKLLDCIGDTAAVPFVTMGSRDVCVWANSQNTVCEKQLLGEGEAPHPCPYPVNDQAACDPVSKLPAGFAPVKVTENLDLFRMPEEKTDTGERPVPAAEALRKLRDPAYTKGRADDINKANNGFFAPTNIRDYASRLGWEARVDDYSAVTLDGVSVFSTGYPYVPGVAPESKEWPCAPRKDVTCPAMSPPERANSLLCSYTAECGEKGVRGSRAYMNDRLGRAVLAARILAAVGVGEQFRGPYRPDSIRLLDLADSGEWLGRELSSNWTKWPYGNTAGQLFDDRAIARASALEYWISEYDTFDNDHGKQLVDGEVICINGSTDAQNIIWTPMATGPTDPPLPSLKFRCGSNDWPKKALPIMFKAYATSSGTQAGMVTARIWKGLDRTSDAGNGEPFTRLARELLEKPHNDIVLRPWVRELSVGSGDYPFMPDFDTVPNPETTLLTAYWTEDQYNTIGIAREGLRGRDVLDGMELLADVALRDMKGEVDCSTLPAPKPESLQDISLVEDYLRCIAKKIMKRAENQILVNVPQVAINALSNSYQFQGEIGAAAGKLAAALINMREYQRNIDSEIVLFAGDLKSLRIQLRRNQISSEIADIHKWAAIANQTASCLSSSAEASGAVVDAALPKPAGGPGAALGSAASAVITCVNAMAQIGFAMQENQLSKEDIKLVGEANWIEFQQRVRAHADVLKKTAEELEAAATAMRASLAEIDTQRMKGRRELAKVMMAGTDAMGAQYNVNTVIRRRYNTLQIRYNRARADAIRLAWVARLAIEQRLGMKLANLRDDMALVEAPARWADALCTLSGIDYARIRVEGAIAEDHYADEFLGDYVRKLERVVNSYEHDFPFGDARDTVVISLRDDVTNSRAMCMSSVPNLLWYSARLDIVSDPERTSVEAVRTMVMGADGIVRPIPPAANPAGVWEPVDCDPINISPAGSAPEYEVRNCIKVESLPTVADRPLPTVSSGIGDVLGYRVTFAPGWDPVADPTRTTTSFRAKSAIAQHAALAPGYYRMSWYARPYVLDPSKPTVIHDPNDAVTIRSSNGTPLALTTERTITAPSGGRGWPRYHFVFRVILADNYQVAIVPSPSQATPHAVDVAGLMLENIDNTIVGVPEIKDVKPSLFGPGQYLATRIPGVGFDPVCEDTTGEVFRTKWRRGCMRLCPTGFASCADGEEHCYWELPFDITTEGIEQGGILKQSGFAYGNYNYRLDTIAVNFVGTGLRNCSESFFPSSCYGSGNIPYTIVHLGPYEVRNHTGEIYKAPLFTGRIEHGRGVAAERYVTNPVSSADRALLEPYEHAELRGRPLTGSYILRVWDVDGLSFNAVEDVQVVLDYRYWTRFE